MKTKYILVTALLALASMVGTNAQSFDIDMTKVQPVYSAENGQDMISWLHQKLRVMPLSSIL